MSNKKWEKAFKTLPCVSGVVFWHFGQNSSDVEEDWPDSRSIKASLQNEHCFGWLRDEQITTKYHSFYCISCFILHIRITLIPLASKTRQSSHVCGDRGHKRDQGSGNSAQRNVHKKTGTKPRGAGGLNTKEKK